MIAAAPPEALNPAAPSDPFRASAISSARAVNESNAALPAPLNFPNPCVSTGWTGTRPARCRTTTARDEFSLDLGAQRKDRADLGECQAGRLGVADEGQPGADLRRIIAVATRRARRCGEQSGLLVEADRLEREPVRDGQFSDAHTARLRLDLPACWKVKRRPHLQ